MVGMLCFFYPSYSLISLGPSFIVQTCFNFYFLSFHASTGSLWLMLFIYSKPSEEVILDYDYTFTTPYCGSEKIDQGTKVRDPNFSLFILHFHSIHTFFTQNCDIFIISISVSDFYN